MDDLIKGQVAKVLNSREVVINIGLNQGVSKNMLFDILDPKGENIIDPETKEILGSIKRPKVRVKIINVENKLSIASTFLKKEINVGGHMPDLGLISKRLMPPKWVDVYETFRTEEKTWEDISEEESYVKIGDPVRQVIENAVDDAASPSSYSESPTE